MIDAEDSVDESFTDSPSAPLRSGRRSPRPVEGLYKLRLLSAVPSSVARNNLGNRWTKSHEWAGAIDHYREALRIKPEYGKPRTTGARSCWGQGRRFAVAIDHFRAARQIDPECAEAFPWGPAPLLARGGRCRYRAFLPVFPGSGIRPLIQHRVPIGDLQLDNHVLVVLIDICSIDTGGPVSG